MALLEDGRPRANSRSTLIYQSLNPHQIIQNGDAPALHTSGVSDHENEPLQMLQPSSRSEQLLGEHKDSASSHATDISSNTQTDQSAEHRDVRTLPPWIDSFETADDEHLLHAQATDGLLATPSRAHNAQHHYSPTKPKRRMSKDGYVESEDESSESLVAGRAKTGLFGREPDRGRKWDHVREGDPVIMKPGAPQASSVWTNFIRSSMYGPYEAEDGQRVDNGFLEAQTPGYQNPWRGDVAGDDPEKALGLLHSKKRQRLWYQRLQRILLMHPLVPLAFRVTVLTTSVIALALSVSTFRTTRQINILTQIDNTSTDVDDQVNNTSTMMAIVVDVIAIPYIGYITWDEYKGKPLGLRSPKAKIRLVLLDLFFIIFESANLALAFAALNDSNGSCFFNKSTTGASSNSTINAPDTISLVDRNDMDKICKKSEALAAFLLIALVAWTLTFTVSIFRLVERVGGREDPN